jgi:MGT family glycosyltransferase
MKKPTMQIRSTKQAFQTNNRSPAKVEPMRPLKITLSTSQTSRNMNTNQTNPTGNFLFTTWEGGGNIAPAITVARKLLQRGHRVRFMSDRANREDAEAAGLAFRPWREAPSRPDRSPASCPIRDWEAAAPQEGITRLMDKIMFGPALEYARDVLAELEREAADVVVTSEMLAGVMAACESRDQPFAVLAANLCLFPLPGMPVFGPALPPPRTPKEEALHTQIREGTVKMFDHGLNGLNRARLALGLVPLPSAVEQINAAELYLLATSRAFDFPVKKLPKQIRYVGPQLGEPAWAKGWSSPWPASDRRPLVLVGFSTTFQNHAAVLQKVIDAMASLPVRTLVTLGQIAAEAVRPAPNCALVPSASHDALMREAALVVTHGGHGTVMRALAHHQPMLIMPHGRDQDENAIRVTERGAGLKLPAAATVAEIEIAVRRLLKDSSFAKAARNLGLAIAAETREDVVTQTLQELSARGGKRVVGRHAEAMAC